MLELIEELDSVASKLKKINKELCLQVSTCDKSLNDIKHFIELEELGAIALRKLAQKQKDLLVTRRVAKNKLSELSVLGDVINGKKLFKDKIKAHNSTVAKRTYATRILTLAQALS